MHDDALPIELTDLDRRIWTDELDAFVPQRVFDVHTHIYRWVFNADPAKNDGPYYAFAGQDFAEATWNMLDACDRALMPGREVHRLAFPFPFYPAVDFAASNEFVAEQTRADADSASLMLVHPSMSDDDLRTALEARPFLGFKPYRVFSTTGDRDECRITDFLPERQIAVADEYGLLVMMHLSKRDAIADPQNRADLRRLSDTYPRVRWILAHCGRSYSAWAIEAAAADVAGLPNVWYDVSSVCESDAIAALIAAVGVDRVMYGSDDVPVGVLRGKYVAFGRAWAYLSPTNHGLNLSHCDGRMTFTRYEQLRAMRRAAQRERLHATDLAALFHDTARALVDGVREQRAASVRP